MILLLILMALKENFALSFTYMMSVNVLETSWIFSQFFPLLIKINLNVFLL